MGSHLMETTQHIQEINKVMLNDFNSYYAIVFAGYMFLYLSFFAMLARLVQTRIVKPVVDLTKELQTLK